MFMSRFIRRLARTGMLAVILPVLAVPVARALPTGNLCLGNVTSINPVYPEADFSAVIFFKGNFVGISSNGIAMYGPDGTHWTQVAIPGNPNLQAMAANNSTILAVGTGGITYQSTNGIEWTQGSTVGTGIDLHDVTWTGSNWAVVGDGGLIAISPDGTTWTIENSGVIDNLFGIVYTGETYVVVGAGTRIATSSDDGVTWISQSAPGASGDFEGVAYDPNPGQEKLVIVGSGAAASAQFYSVDQGNTWVQGNLGEKANQVRWLPKPGLFVATNGLNNSNVLRTSPDGINWTITTSFTTPAVTSALFGVIDVVANPTGTIAVAVGQDTEILTTKDFMTWRQFYVGVYPNVPGSNGVGANGAVTGIATDGALGIVEVALGDASPNPFNSPAFYSQDGGQTFSFTTMPSVNTMTPTAFDAQAVAYSPTLNAFVAVGNDNSIEESVDGGFSWTISLQYNAKAQEPTFNNVIWDGGTDNIFLAVGDPPNAGLGVIQYSTDGATWAASGIKTPTSLNVYGVAANGAGRGVAVGGGNVTSSLTGTEGVVLVCNNLTAGTAADWKGSGLGFQILNSVAYGNGLWVIVGGNATTATVYTSPDVLNPQGTMDWSINGLQGAAANVNSVIFSNGFFFAFGSDGNVYISIDSVTWLPCVGPAPTGVGLVKGAVSAVGLDFISAGNETFTGKTPPAPPPVTITKQPKDTAAVFGKSLTLTALGTSTGGGLSFPVFYQWRLNGVDLINGGSVHGANSASLTINPLTTAFAGNYTVIVSNGLRSTTSLVAKVTVNYPPKITKQPQSQHVPIGPGSELILYVTAGGGGNPPVNGTAPLTYQWYVGSFKLVNNSVVQGAKGPQLTIKVVQPRRSGNYTVRVTNPYGTVTSQIAVVKMG